VRVRTAADLDARLPAERAARVVVRAGGREHVREVPNPVGDADHHPLGEAEVLDLLSGWLPDDATVAAVRAVAAGLPTAADAGALLRELAR
jgi:hypothetical protein